MNKVTGSKSDFALVRQEPSRTVVAYGQKKLDNKHYEWWEVYFYNKKKGGKPSMDDVKAAILADINQRTDQKILSGFQWNEIHVWLSAENQRNFSEAQRMASANASILPLTFKLGEDAEGQPVYHTFETAEELNQFYASAFGYINECLNEGWQEKDRMDFSQYEEFFPAPEISDNQE